MHARFHFPTAVALLIGGAWFACLATAHPPAEPMQTTEPQQAEKAKAPSHAFSGPYTHDNLTIFLVHGEDRLKGRKYMMLAEASKRSCLSFTKRKRSTI